MVHKKSAPFGLACLPGAGESGYEKHISPLTKAQLKNFAFKGTCLQCGRLSHSVDCAGFCTVLCVSRSFLFIMLPCSCSGFVSRCCEEVPA